jgi:hypothetical protein
MTATLTRKGAALVALFSILPAFAEQAITKGNQRTPYEPPEWFTRMEKPPLAYVPDEIREPIKAPRLQVGKLFAESGRYFCWKTREGRDYISTCEN